jgi:hypothetical protein
MVHIRAVIKTQNTCNRGSWPQEISKEKNNKMCGNSSMKQKGPQQNPLVDLPGVEQRNASPWPPPPSDAEDSVRRDSIRRLDSRAAWALGHRRHLGRCCWASGRQLRCFFCPLPQFPGWLWAEHSGEQQCDDAEQVMHAGTFHRLLRGAWRRELRWQYAVTTTTTPLADATGCKEVCTRRSYQ